MGPGSLIWGIPVKELVIILAGYALGCLSTGYYLVRFRTGQDVRSLGSGSTGSSNVSRALGAPGFVVTFVGDVSKAAIAVWSAHYLELEPWWVMLVMIAVLAGSIWPVQLGFRGGKGLATVLGAVLLFDYRLVLVAAVLAAVILAPSRRRTLAGMLPVAISPGVAAMLGHGYADVVGVSALALLVLFAHRTKLQEAIARTRHPSGGVE